MVRPFSPSSHPWVLLLPGVGLDSMMETLRCTGATSSAAWPRLSWCSPSSVLLLLCVPFALPETIFLVCSRTEVVVFCVAHMSSGVCSPSFPSCGASNGTREDGGESVWKAKGAGGPAVGRGGGVGRRRTVGFSVESGGVDGAYV